MPDISKLPKWVQQHIATLEVRVARAEQQLEALSSGSLVDPSHQKFYTQEFRGEAFFLPQYSNLYFKQDPTREGIHDFQVAKSDDSLGGVQVRSGAWGRLAVIPQASNVVNISLIKD